MNQAARVKAARQFAATFTVTQENAGPWYLFRNTTGKPLGDCPFCGEPIGRPKRYFQLVYGNTVPWNDAQAHWYCAAAVQKLHPGLDLIWGA